MAFEPVIGLEIHVELLTESKMFCGCAVTFGEAPNTQVCPICLGHPGTLPVINEKAIEYTVRTGLAFDCQIASFCQFHRKNYFYPDLPKSYQISQYDLPLCRQGHLDITVDGEPRRVDITRVHLEEDTGKLVHVGGEGRIAGADYSLVDFNRSGVPLMEVVTEPDIRSAEEAKVFLQQLKNILEHLGVSDCNMEQGSLRCDANVSVRQEGESELGVKTEVKNMNSIRSLQRALSFEVERHVETLESGGRIEQETRHWDEAASVTTSLRTKEYAHDYRYFPEPDLVPLELSEGYIEEVRGRLPELPQARRQRLMREESIPEHAATVLTSSKAMGDFFEDCLKDYDDAKKVANWMLGEFSMHLNAAGLDISEAAVTPKHLVSLLRLIDKGEVSGKMGKEIFEQMFETGKLPQIIVEEQGLKQISDEGEVGKVIDMVLQENSSVADDYRNGKEKALGFLVGQVMRLTAGQANPQLVNRLLKERLSSE